MSWFQAEELIKSHHPLTPPQTEREAVVCVSPLRMTHLLVIPIQLIATLPLLRVLEENQVIN